MRLTLRHLLETVEAGYLDDNCDACLRDPSGNSHIEDFLREELARIGPAQGPSRIGTVAAWQESRSLFAHEAAALDDIRRHVELHGLGEVLANLELHDPQSNRYFEVDLAVVSRFGIYVGELKHWSGRIEIRPNSWLQNGSFFKADPHKANNFKAKLLRGIYDRHFPQFPSVYFESVVILTNPDVSADGASISKTTVHNPTFDSINRFLEYLKNQRNTTSSFLTEAQCHAFAEYVRKLHTSAPPRDFVFPGYEIVERLYQHVDRAEVVAKRTDIRHRRLSRLRIFFPPTDGTEAERLLAHERATATLNAVAKIGDHPNVLKVWSIPNENNYVVEGSDWSETGTLRDVLEREERLKAERATKIAAGLAHGLHAIHQECVVHRALSPESVLMVDDIPKLMNFDLSFQLEDDRVTVIPDATKLKRTPYIAPEIYSGGVVPESTADLFSLGVILYEMLTGKRPFGCSTDLERSGGRLTTAHRQELVKQQVPATLVDLVFDLVQQNPDGRPGDAMQVAKQLEADRAPPVVMREANPRLAAAQQSGFYAIEAFLKCGAESQIYRAVGVRGRQVALKLFNCDVPLQRVVDEQRFAAAIHHSSIVRVDSYNQWTDGRYYIAFDWASERSLRDDVVDGVRPDIDRFCRVASQILDALAALHQNAEEGRPSPILHNDVKPDNTLLDEGDRPVLVDFGAASAPHIGTYEGTEGYVAPDLRLGQDRKYCEDGDLYALAVTLHEWLVGCRPGEAEDAVPGVSPAVMEWLQKGSSSDAVQRFASATEMRHSLQAALAQKEPVTVTVVPEVVVTAADISAEPSQEPERLTLLPAVGGDPNPFVSYLNSLHSRNAETDNALAESQACNPFFNSIHVPHPLIKTIEEIFLGTARRHVIVTGHAGDGKSTIVVELFKRLTDLPVAEPLVKPLKRREDVSTPALAVSLVKDFSEWSRAERAALLSEMLDPAGKRFFLVSNTGTLLDAFKAHELTCEGDGMWIESTLLGAMNTLRPSDVPFHDASFVVINIAMCDNLGIAEQIFGRMLAAERWQACSSAECRSHCPVLRNVALIRANQQIVTQRLFLAYRRMYEYGTRLTLRQLCAHMAYMITSGLSYDDVVKMSQRASPPMMAEFMFFNRFFGDNGKEVDGPATQIRAVRAIREQEFGVQPCPTWERKLWLRSRGLTFQLRSVTAPDDFDTLRRIGAGAPSNDAITAPEAREQVRRAVFFLHSFDDGDDGSFLKAFLKSVMLLDFARWQTQTDETLSLQETTSLHRRVMHVLQEHFTGVRLPEGAVSDRHLFVTLSRRSHDVRQSAQVVLARYPEDDFQVRLVSDDNGVGGIRRELILDGRARSGDLLLSLGLPFLDYVMMRNQGEVGKDLQASYVDRLERFKGQLIRRSTSKQGDDIMLVRLRTNHTFRRQIFAVRGNRLEVTDG
ncbi:MAG: protein kinase [Planctomycetes bacterium]|nr:protein kinase [Planctomycetota bacterium]MCG2684791.1 protein kinase [Planctomycetales bacterium]